MRWILYTEYTETRQKVTMTSVNPRKIRVETEARMGEALPVPLAEQEGPRAHHRLHAHPLLGRFPARGGCHSKLPPNRSARQGRFSSRMIGKTDVGLTLGWTPARLSSLLRSAWLRRPPGWKAAGERLPAAMRPGLGRAFGPLGCLEEVGCTVLHEPPRRSMQLMNRITAILLPPLLLLPSLARAEEEKSNLPHVFLVPFQVLGAAGSDLVTGKLTEQLETDLEGRTGKLMLLTEPAAPTFVDEGSSLNAETSGLQSMLLPARRHYRIGMGLLQIERFEEAMTELNEAIRLYEGNLAFLKPDDFNELLQAFVQLSVAAMRAGYEDEAEEAISQVVRMSSDFNPAGKGLPPIYQKIVGRHRRKIDKLGAGTMEIVTNPPTAKVFVDGKEQGETPLTLKKIGAGMHFVQLARPLAGVWAEKIEFPGR
ncbi:MAG: PEGA domain-containing protein, partial [Deltaproteobacteria bacterium]|nr:PEGA domain-containing protein [Deltaproteobacteria bacterium]